MALFMLLVFLKKKILNILETTDCRTKRVKFRDSWSFELHVYGTFQVCFFEFSLESFSVLCTIQMFKVQTST